MVHNSSNDPNNRLLPTTKLHISQYVRHLAQLLNTSSAFNSRETSWETATLVLTDKGSGTTGVPVETMKPADVNPPAPALTTLLTHETIERIVECIMEQQLQPEQKKQQTKTCMWTSKILL